MPLLRVCVQWTLCCAFCATCCAYTPKAKSAVPSIFKRMANIEPYATTRIIPKFAVMTGTEWSLHGLAIAAQSIVTECNGDVYLGYNTCSGDHNAILGNVNNVYRAVIESVPVDVVFSHDVPPTSAITDSFDTTHQCRPTFDRPGFTLECAWPFDTAYQIDQHGNARLWLYTSPSYGIDTAVLACACVVAFAVLLERSKTTTRQLKQKRPVSVQSTPWTVGLFRDLIVAVLWILNYSLLTVLPRHLLHPSVGVVVSTGAAQDTLGFAMYVALTVNGIAATLCMSRHVLPVYCRTTYETFLLLAMVVLTPVSVAPLFHAIFEACIGASVLFINSRDCLWNENKNPVHAVLVVVTSILNWGVACFLLLPAMVDCDAVPAMAEGPLSAVTTLQIIAASILSR